MTAASTGPDSAPGAGPPSARAYVIGTFDTKGEELRYVAAQIQAAGVPVTTVDVGTGGLPGAASGQGSASATTPQPAGGPSPHAFDRGSPGTPGPDVTAAEVASCHPDGAQAVATQDRGQAVSQMSRALRAWMDTRADVGGVLGLGGSGGTALITPAMRALPIGRPKVMVSTMASGDVGNYVDGCDIAMLYSVTDIVGLNRISRQVLANAANALAGALLHPVPAAVDAPALGLTMFGVTTPCVSAVAGLLAADGDPLVFHATGTGGRAMEKLVDDGLIDGVLDITTTEICDLVVGGVFSAGPTRLDAIARTGVPYVGSVGALDMVNFGPRETVPEQFARRNLYVHNDQVTLMRTTPEECAEIARFIAAKLNACTGEVRLLFPEHGVSGLDADGQPFHDPAADEVLRQTLHHELNLTDSRRMEVLPMHINDPEFAEALVAAYREIAGRERS